MKKDIYIIKNTINNKVYIGQSVDSEYRFRKHKEAATDTMGGMAKKLIKYTSKISTAHV